MQTMRYGQKRTFPENGPSARRRTSSLVRSVVFARWRICVLIHTDGALWSETFLRGNRPVRSMVDQLSGKIATVHALTYLRINTCRRCAMVWNAPSRETVHPPGGGPSLW